VSPWSKRTALWKRRRSANWPRSPQRSVLVRGAGLRLERDGCERAAEPGGP
jgi:hypothetical protein